MEHTVYCRGFSAKEAMRPTVNKQGEVGEQPFMQITVLDAGGDVVHLMIGLTDWPSFQECMADPDGFLEKMAEARRAAESRATILGPLNGGAPSSP